MLTSWRQLCFELQSCTSLQSLSIFDDVAFITAVCGAVLHVCSHLLRPWLCFIAMLVVWRRCRRRLNARCSISRRPPYGRDMAQRHVASVYAHRDWRALAPRARVTQLPTRRFPAWELPRSWLVTLDLQICDGEPPWRYETCPRPRAEGPHID